MRHEEWRGRDRHNVGVVTTMKKILFVLVLLLSCVALCWAGGPSVEQRLNDFGGTVGISNGGTSNTASAAALTALGGLHANVPVAIASGGTSATTAAAACTALGIGNHSKLTVDTSGNMVAGDGNASAAIGTTNYNNATCFLVHSVSIGASSTVSLDTIFGTLNSEAGLLTISVTSNVSGGAASFYLAATSGATEITDALATFGTAPDEDDFNVYQATSGNYVIQNHTSGTRNMVVRLEGYHQ